MGFIVCVCVFVYVFVYVNVCIFVLNETSRVSFVDASNEVFDSIGWFFCVIVFYFALLHLNNFIYQFVNEFYSVFGILCVITIYKKK